MHAGVDLREMVQGRTGALGNIDGFLVAEQSLNEAFDFLHARTAQALEIVGIRLDRLPCQPERLRSRLPSSQIVPEARQILQQRVESIHVVELGPLATPQGV